MGAWGPAGCRWFDAICSGRSVEPSGGQFSRWLHVGIALAPRWTRELMPIGGGIAGHKAAPMGGFAAAALARVGSALALCLDELGLWFAFCQCLGWSTCGGCCLPHSVRSACSNHLDATWGCMHVLHLYIFQCNVEHCSGGWKSLTRKTASGAQSSEKTCPYCLCECCVLAFQYESQHRCM